MAFTSAPAQGLFRLGLGQGVGGGEVMAAFQAGEEIRRVRRGFLRHQGHRQAVGVQGHAVTEQHQQKDGHDEGDGDAAGVAHDLEELLAHQALEAHERAAAWL
jgi:hypothetical protein